MMNDRILEHYVEEFGLGLSLEPVEAETLFDALIASDDADLIADVLTAWNEKGTTEDELVALVQVMRGRMRRVDSKHRTVVDIVGTGGGRAKSFNVSTAAAFVIAGAGVAVAKHGNRAATSKCGSADVLAALGVDMDVDPAITESHLNEHGLCFMFAPRFHSLSPTLAAARRQVGQPTIFNNLGPLCNPAGVEHQVIGVWDPDMLESTANALVRLGAGRSWVVHGENGLDEIALKGETHVIEIKDEKLERFTLTAADFDVYTLGNDLPADCTAQESAEVIRSVLNGDQSSRDVERLVLVNAAAAIYAANGASTLPEAYLLAEQSVRSGAAADKLAVLAEATT